MGGKQALAAGALALYLVASVSILRLPQPVADWFVAEDGGFEWLGALALLSGSALLLLTVLRLQREQAPLVTRLSFLAVALVLLVGAGEEISWGQRLLGVETPEAIARVNSQGEINLHNLYGDENGQNVGDLLWRVFWMVFGVLLPLFALVRPVGQVLRRYLPVAPAWVALLFVAQQLLWKPVQASWRSDPSAWHATYRGRIGEEPYRVETVAEAVERGATGPAGLIEIVEANIQVLLCVAAVCLYLERRRRADRDALIRPLPR